MKDLKSGSPGSLMAIRLAGSDLKCF